MRLMTVDPGKAGLGWAVFDDGRLMETGILENGSMVEAVRMLERVSSRWRPDASVIEVPQVYPQRVQKGDPNDLIDVAVIAGIAVAVLSTFCVPQLVRPHKWKGSRPKAVDNQRTLGLLDADELDVLKKSGASSSKQHNVLDAVGIGLWKEGR